MKTFVQALTGTMVGGLIITSTVIGLAYLVTKTEDKIDSIDNKLYVISYETKRMMDILEKEEVNKG